MITGINIDSLINKTGIEQLPEISDRLIDIYKEQIPDWNKPDASAKLCLQSKVKDLRKLTDFTEKAKNQETFHKVLSVSLLAVSVALVASGIILACCVNPLFLLLIL